MTAEEKGEGMTSDERARIKRCIATFLCGSPGVVQAEVAYSMMDALEDDHLKELDGMIHIYETDEKTEIVREPSGRGKLMPIPIIIETSNPEVYPRYWTVRADTDPREHQVAMRIDHGLHADIFICSCGSKYTWSPGVVFDAEPCLGILSVCLALLEERNKGVGHEQERISERPLRRRIRTRSFVKRVVT